MTIQIFFYTPPELSCRYDRKLEPKRLKDGFFFPVGTHSSTHDPIGNFKNEIEPYLRSLNKSLVLYVEVSAKKHFLEDKVWWSSQKVKFNFPDEEIHPALPDTLRKILNKILPGDFDPILSSLGSKEPVLDSCLTFSIQTEPENEGLKKFLNEIMITYPSVAGAFVLYAKNKVFYHSNIAEDRDIYFALKNWIYTYRLDVAQKLDTMDCQRMDCIFQQRVVSIFYIKKEQSDVVVGFFCKKPSEVGAAYRKNTEEVVNQMLSIL